MLYMYMRIYLLYLVLFYAYMCIYMYIYSMYILVESYRTATCKYIASKST